MAKSADVSMASRRGCATASEFAVDWFRTSTELIKISSADWQMPLMMRWLCGGSRTSVYVLIRLTWTVRHTVLVAVNRNWLSFVVCVAMCCHIEGVLFPSAVALSRQQHCTNNDYHQLHFSLYLHLCNCCYSGSSGFFISFSLFCCPQILDVISLLFWVKSFWGCTCLSGWSPVCLHAFMFECLLKKSQNIW